MPSFYAPIDLLKNELRQAVIQNLGAAPGTPSPGQMYYDTGTSTLYYWNGTAWIAASAAAGGPPTGAAGGDLGGTYPNPTVVKASSTFTVNGPSGSNALVVNSAAAGGTNSNGITFQLAGAPAGRLFTLGTGGSVGLSTDCPMSIGGVLTMLGNRIGSVADPIAGGDAATKNYVDNAINGTSWRAPVRVATTANITLSGTQTIDGVAVVAGDRVLVKNQTTAAQNGIYVVAAGAWTRSTDADAWNELINAAVFVQVGSQADTAWVSTVDAGGTIGTTAVTWVQFGAGAVYTAGSGIIIAGNVISVDTAIVVPTTRQILTTAPITGGGNLTADRTIGITSFAGSTPGAVPNSPGGTTSFLRADGTWAAPAAPAGMVSKFAAALTGTVAYATGEVVTHNLNTRDVDVAVVNSASPYQRIEVDWEATTVNTVTIRYSPNIGAGFRAVVMG